MEPSRFKDVEVCGWETFGLTWVKDITKQLKLENVTVHKTDNYGELPDLSKVNFDNDVVLHGMALLQVYAFPMQIGYQIID